MLPALMKTDFPQHDGSLKLKEEGNQCRKTGNREEN